MNNTIHIVTPQNVRIEFRLATLGTRALALLFDLLIVELVVALIQVGLFYVIFDFMRMEDGDLGMSILLSVGLLLMALLPLIYFLISEAAFRGRTIGKRIMGLRVIQQNGQPVTFVSTLIRTALRLADMLPGTWALGAAVMFGTKRAQRLGDLVAGTIVVQEDKKRAPKPRAEVTDPLMRKVNIYPVSAEMFDYIKSLLARKRELQKNDYNDLLFDTAHYLRWKLQVSSAMEPDDQIFLQKVYEYNQV